MSKENNGGPAFPALPITREINGEILYQSAGLTIRDYFAAKAMQSWVSVTTKTYIHRGEHQVEMTEIDAIAEAAYRQADAMLRAREL